MSRTDHRKVVQMAETDAASHSIGVRVPGLGADPRSQIAMPESTEMPVGGAALWRGRNLRALPSEAESRTNWQGLKRKALVAWQGIKVEAPWEDQVCRLTRR